MVRGTDRTGQREERVDSGSKEQGRRKLSRLSRILLVITAALLVLTVLAVIRPFADTTIATVTERFRQEHGLPGGVLAFGQADGTPTVLPLGWDDPARETPMAADRLFNLASLSKPLTGAAVLALARQGRLSLADRLADHLDLPAGSDPRLAEVTVNALLSHAAGSNSGSKVMLRS